MAGTRGAARPAGPTRRGRAPAVAASGRRAEKRGGAGGWVVEGEYAPTSASGGDTALGATVFPRPSAPVVSCALSPRLDGELERTARHLRLRLRNCERADNDGEERFVSVAFGTPAVRARAATRPVRRVGFAGRRVWARARGRRASRSREGGRRTRDARRRTHLEVSRPTRAPGCGATPARPENAARRDGGAPRRDDALAVVPETMREDAAAAAGPAVAIMFVVPPIAALGP